MGGVGDGFAGDPVAGRHDGVSRENVNRALAVLTAGGAIRREGNRYVLVDEARLRREVAGDWPVLARRDRRRGT